MKYKFAFQVQQQTIADRVHSAVMGGRQGDSKTGAVLVTGATIGIQSGLLEAQNLCQRFFYWSFPAGSMREHIRKYHLPTSHMDIIV